MEVNYIYDFEVHILNFILTTFDQRTHRLSSYNAYHPVIVDICYITYHLSKVILYHFNHLIKSPSTGSIVSKVAPLFSGISKFLILSF